ncbi:NAD(P)-dependent dehydrogenase (short-subunit alcohol dehydrogenase family) [Bradyrhizobium sp. LA2.1]
MTKNGKRVAWVTGGGSGIGEAGAEALAADGWIVVVSGRRKDALDTVVAKIAKAGGAAEAIALDVSNAAEAQKAADQIVAKHGRIDLLVNNAGINVPKRSWKDMELEGWDKLVQVNLNGVLYCSARCCPRCASSRMVRSSTSRPGPAATSRRCRARPTPPPSMRCWR